MNTAYVCPSCGQSFVAPAAAVAGVTHCPRCGAALKLPGSSDVLGSIQIDPNRRTLPASTASDRWSLALIGLMVLICLALLPIVYFVVSNALQK